jgi:hypothetical protein
LKLPLCKLFNMSLKKRIFPMEWKRANHKCHTDI